MNRSKELLANLTEVRESIARETSREVTLIVVTKTWPASDVTILHDLGVNDVGENRDQEAHAKHDEVAQDDLVWHCIGQVQTNKARSVAQWADVVHSVDRLSLVAALERASVDRKNPLKVLIQVNLDTPAREGRGGALPAQVLELAQEIAKCDHLELCGVMGVAPLDQDPDPAFAGLQQVSESLVSQYPQATWISAGMSQDYASALKFGATHLRIGSTVLGHRPAAE